MRFLTVNAWSSSVKWGLFDDEKNGDALRVSGSVASLEKRRPVAEDIDVIVHRVVHGGSKYHEPVVITPEVEDEIRRDFDLAPLHNPLNLSGIIRMKELYSHAVQVAVFDTAFHSTIAPERYLYPVPYERYEEYGIRKYGFHGISHRYVAQRIGELMDRDRKNLGIISCHIGSGASVTAIQDGKVVTTSMGLTPLGGLMMGTRSGDIDPDLFAFVSKKSGMGIEEISDALYHKSWLLGVSGISNSPKEILAAGGERAAVTIKKYINTIAEYIGGYWTALDRVDVIVLTGGVMENSDVLKGMLLGRLASLGIVPGDTTVVSQEGLLTAAGSRVPVWLVPTDEEVQMVRDAKRVL